MHGETIKSIILLTSKLSTTRVCRCKHHIQENHSTINVNPQNVLRYSTYH